jgi:hypothetical protein
MKHLLAVPAIVGIIATAGCDLSDAGSLLGPGGVNNSAVGGQTGAEETSDTLTVFFEASGSGALLSRAKATGNGTVWTSEDLASLTERDGIVVGTQGLTTDLVSIETPSPATWDTLTPPRAVPAIHRHFSDSEGPWMRAYMCDVSPTRTVSLPVGDSIETVWETNLSCRNSDQSYEDTFWRDRTGKVVLARQWLGEQLGYVNLQYPWHGNTRQAADPGDEQ